MNKKLLALLVSLLVICSIFNSFALTPKFTPIEPKELNYTYGSLEPYIDKETMIIHHNKHYKTYVEKLNATLEKYLELYNCTVYDLLTNLDSLPKEAVQSVKNNGGGVYNHEFFFDIMTQKKTIPSARLEEAINKTFGSLDNFKEEFKKASLNVFGSGWAWLVSDQGGNLSIITTANQDSPITLGFNPIIGIDLWEHAYYLRYQNNRSNYIDNWFHVINWDKALINYTNPLK
ncbi:superoxide dismutase [Romboutsia sp.]|uniref:superoxide dismutase n=1 Tax=Romboutsia sp. TaxID=1965302 RepID=UPI003F41ADAB